jgi:hypothetical protein
VKVVARKMGLITKETPEDIAKKEGVMVDELSPEKLEQAKAIVLDGSQMALMMEEGLSHIMRTHDEVVISGYACPPPLPFEHSLDLRVAFFSLSFFCRFSQNGREPEAQDRQSGPDDEEVRGTRAAPASSWPHWERR